MNTPNVLAHLALWAYFPATLATFYFFGPRRGLVYALLGGWLLLPNYTAALEFPLFHDKPSLVPAVLTAASLLTDLRRWRGLRPHLLDLPAALLSLLPFASALSNELGAYEAASAALAGIATWGLPYALGRVYLGSPRAQVGFAAAMVAAAVAYVPLCVWEIRMSPTLQYQVYGFATFQFLQSVRFGGYRPTVFLGHGLALAMFLASAALLGYWLWRNGFRRAVLGLPPGWAVLLLAAATFASRSAGAIALLLAGLALLEASRWLRSPILVLALMALPALYAATRVAGWSGEALVTLATDVAGPERAESIAYRLRNENLLIAKALQRPALGWGRWGRFFVYDDSGAGITVPDGMWVILLGSMGTAGLAALLLFLALPVLALLRRFPRRAWTDPRLAAATANAAVLLLWAVDDVLNSFVNPAFLAMAGAITGIALRRRAAARRSDARATADGRRLGSRPRPAAWDACQGPSA